VTTVILAECLLMILDYLKRCDQCKVNNGLHLWLQHEDDDDAKATMKMKSWWWRKQDDNGGNDERKTTMTTETMMMMMARKIMMTIIITAWNRSMETSDKAKCAHTHYENPRQWPCRLVQYQLWQPSADHSCCTCTLLHSTNTETNEQ